MNLSEFLEQCKEKGYKRKDIKNFELAVKLISHLKNKIRISGDTFFDHNLRVALILVKNRAMPEIVIAGLLHGLNDKESEFKVKEKFGPEIFALLSGIDEVKRIKFQNKKLEAEALRRIILTTIKDVRVILIQLANKIDNLQTTNLLPKADQKRIAEEVLEFYAPLAYRLGLEKMKAQLENSAFKLLNPKFYQEINNYLKDSQEQREQDINTTIELIKKISENQVKLLKIKGRTKQVYSIYKKIVERKVPLNEQYDLFGIRILVPELKDCYSLLGLLHEKFEPVEGRLKDYITAPKPNGYRSIHTGIRLPNNKIVEIQIRTPEMDETAEEGIAAHWHYKGLNSEKLFEKKVAWLREVLDLQKNLKCRDFLDAAKVDVFGDGIYCYTPKGDVKELPKDSTLLDFAFSIHERIGATAVGGRVNGKFVPLRTELKQGDIVEIITNKNQRPRRTWLKIVRSSKSKQKIRKYLKEFESLPALHYHQLKPEITEEQGILVESEEFPNAVCILAKCCKPIPEEKIVGLLTKRRVISVHKDTCDFALKEECRWINVAWKNTFNQKLTFHVEAKERSGLLADLLHTIANAKFEVKGAKAKIINVEYMQCSFLLIPKDLEHLKNLITKVRKVRGVSKIYFE